jgi:ubiquitin
MKRPWLTTLGILVSGVVAVGICVVGYKVNAHQQNEQNITYARSTIKQEAKRLPTVQKEVAALYADANKDGLKPGLTATEVNEVETDVKAIKSTGEDFGIEDSDIPNNASKLIAAKKGLTTDINDINDKLTIQTAIDKLFTVAVANWPVYTDDVIITKDLTNTKIEEIRDDVTVKPEGTWRTIATQYLDSAKAQIDQVSTVNTLLDTLVKDGKLTDTATYADYNDLVTAVAAIRNPDLNAEYQAKADEVATLITGSTTAATEESTYTAPTKANDEASTYAAPVAATTVDATGTNDATTATPASDDTTTE